MGFIHMDISAWIYPHEYIHMDISLWIYPYHIWVPRDPLGGIPWVGYLGWDTLGGPMGPWDRWDLGLMDPGPQGPPIIDLIGPVKRKFRIPVPDPRLPGPATSRSSVAPALSSR